MSLSDRERAIRQRLKDDFAHYSSKCLRIRTKPGSIAPFHLNQAQRFLHDKAEDQLKRFGKVRLIVLKGRQQGISTYIEGRAYWKTTHRKGYRTFILTHMADATQNLFAMARRYHEHCPELVRPSTDRESSKALRFNLLDSDYAVGTAGTSGAGRSSTVQFFHGSEVAYWDHAESHAAGVLQAVPDAPDTEVFFESTANGPGDYFHRVWQGAQAGQGDMEAVFIPWYWQDEYRRPAVALDDDEKALQERYSLDAEQMAWRRYKIVELGDEALFRREYPFTPEEAFMSSDDRAFMVVSRVEDAMRPRDIPPDAVGPKVMAVDVARFGDDRTAVAIRQGRVVHPIHRWAKADTMDTVGRVKRLIDSEQPDAVFVDDIGVGGGVVDRLREMGYDIRQANSSRKALDDARYLNKRHEMYGEFRDWLADELAMLPSDDDLRADLAALRIKRFDSNGRFQLHTKEEMKAQGLRSPDLADAVAMTFYEPVAEAFRLPQVSGGGSWMV